MAIDEITAEISIIPALRLRATVNKTIQTDKDDFVNKYEANNNHLVNNTVSEMNTMKDQINTTASQINTAVDTVVEKEALVSPHYTAIDAVYANEGNINAVNANATNINAVNANSTNINAVVANETNINAVNANKTNIDLVANNETNINNVSNNMSDINNLDTNMSDINLIADAIQSGTLPTIIDDTTSSTLKTYSSSKIDSQISTAVGSIDLSSKQDVLVSGTNIKTLNGASLLGSGDIVGVGSTLNSFNKSVVNGEELVLQSATPTNNMIVSVQKPIVQPNIVNNNWTFGVNDYELEKYTGIADITITLEDSTFGSLSLSSGNFSSKNVGCIVYAGTGSAMLTNTDGSITVLTEFDKLSYSVSEWYMEPLKNNMSNIRVGLLVPSKWRISAVSSAISSYQETNYDVVGNQNTSVDIQFSDNGLVLIVPDVNPDTSYREILRYTLTSPFDVSTIATFSTNTMGDYNYTDFEYCASVSKLYTLYRNGSEIREYNSGNIFTSPSMPTRTYVAAHNLYSQVRVISSITFTADGTSVYVCGTYPDAGTYNNPSGIRVCKYPLSTPFLLSTRGTGVMVDIPNNLDTVIGITFYDSGTVMYVKHSLNVKKYSLSTPYDISTATCVETGAFSIGGQNKVRIYNNGKNIITIDGKGKYSMRHCMGYTSQQTEYATALSNTLDSSYITNIDSIVTTDTKNNGNNYYGLSFDVNKNSWFIVYGGKASRNIVRYNNGYEYNSATVYKNEEWTVCISDTANGAISEALKNNSTNRIDNKQLKGKVANYYPGNTTGAVTVGIGWDTNYSQFKSYPNGSYNCVSDGYQITSNKASPYTSKYLYKLPTTQSNTITFLGRGFSVANNGSAFSFADKGKHIFYIYAGTLYYRTLSTPYDTTNLTWSSKTITGFSTSVGYQDVGVAKNGLTLWAIRPSNNTWYVDVATMSTPFDFSTATFKGTFQPASPADGSGNGTNAQSISMSEDGLTGYVFSYLYSSPNTKYMDTFSLAIDNDWTTAIFVSRTYHGNPFSSSAFFYNNGELLYSLSENKIYSAEQYLAVQYPTLDDAITISVTQTNNSIDSLPSYSGATIQYDGYEAYTEMTRGTEYNVVQVAEDKVKITFLTNNNVKGRIL